MHLPLFSAAFAALSLTFYVLLDGFDLGVGILLLFETDEQNRDHMIDSITPTWDGNETWLIMAGVTLLAGFPIAYGILMPALYVPLIIMLLALGLRGVTFEFRVQIKRLRRRWDIVFGIGSVLAAAMQGIVLGALIQGISVQGNSFDGDVFDCFTLFSCLCSACVLLVYGLLGSAWLQFKGSQSLVSFSRRSVRVLLPLFVILFLGTTTLSFKVQPGVITAWRMHALPLVACSIVMIGAILVVEWARTQASPRISLVATMIMTAAGIIGLAALVYPNIVPFKVSLWQASSSHLSQVFLMTGVCLVAPVVLGYSLFAYWVFRGKTPQAGWEL
jgi:cytochrome d ubiquinol oxidase subunit II